MNRVLRQDRISWLNVIPVHPQRTTSINFNEYVCCNFYLGIDLMWTPSTPWYRSSLSTRCHVKLSDEHLFGDLSTCCSPNSFSQKDGHPDLARACRSSCPPTRHACHLNFKILDSSRVPARINPTPISYKHLQSLTQVQGTPWQGEQKGHAPQLGRRPFLAWLDVANK